jgi:hypothetical protein
MRVFILYTLQSLKTVNLNEGREGRERKNGRWR